MNSIEYDIVICLGPNDHSLFPKFIDNIRSNVMNTRSIYVITPRKMIDTYLNHNLPVIYIDESIFPFSLEYINTLFNKPERSGWYLQQLIKLYAPILIDEMLDNFLILDADLYFHKPVTFFENNLIQFNTGTEYHIPYFDHMNKVHPSLTKNHSSSGICHLMPMKRKIIQSFIHMIEHFHADTPAWKVILDCVSPNHYHASGASEYEMLFTYTIQTFPEDCVIRPLKWQNTYNITNGYDGVYEAWHYYMR